MRKETRVERYLRQLGRELTELPEDARAAVLAEVKSQIERARGRDRTTEEVLREMGPPKLIARSYVKTTGGHASDAKSRWRRWLAVGTVAFFALVFAGGLTVILKLSPAAPNGAAPAPRLWGTAVKVGEPAGQVRPVDTPVVPPSADVERVTGSKDLTESRVTKVVIPFNTGKIELEPSASHDLTWSCLASLRDAPTAAIVAGVLTLDLDALKVARCVIGLPSNAKVEVRGANGHMEIKRPVAALDVQLGNGRVSILPDANRAYDFDVRVKNGLQDFFRRSNSPRAVKIKVNVTNGTVKKE